MMKQTLAVCTVLGLALGLAACSPSYYKEANQNVEKTQKQLKDSRKALDTTRPAAVEHAGYYVSGKPIAMTSSPIWLKNRVTMRAQDMPLDLLMSQLTRNNGINVSYQPSMKQSQPVTVNYSGSLKGLLNKLAAQYDLDYQAVGNTVNWQAFETRTFNISFMPGTTDYLMGQTAGQESGLNQQQGGGSSGSSNVVVTRGSVGSESQYSNLKASSLSVWKDLSDTLNELKSPVGKVMVSESTTSVTVRDHPSNVRSMATYIKQLNKDLSREVTIRVQVIDIQLNKQFHFGVNWNMVNQILGTPVGIAGDVANLANPSATIVNTASGLLQVRIGSSTGSHSIIQALGTQGKLSIVTQPQVTTMNNQVAAIQITQDTGYLQSVSTTTTQLSGSTESLTPGIVTTGFTMYVLPKIEGKKVFMQITGNLSNLISLEKVSNAPPPVAGQVINVAIGAQAPQSIQVPVLSDKHFNQRTVVLSGTTVIITGFKQTRNNALRSGTMGPLTLGGKGADRQDIETIVMITPTIVETS